MDLQINSMMHYGIFQLRMEHLLDVLVLLHGHGWRRRRRSLSRADRLGPGIVERSRRGRKRARSARIGPGRGSGWEAHPLVKLVGARPGPGGGVADERGVVPGALKVARSRVGVGLLAHGRALSLASASSCAAPAGQTTSCRQSPRTPSRTGAARTRRLSSS